MISRADQGSPSITLGRADLANQLARTHYPRKLPRVLAADQVARLIEASPGPGLKYKAALGIAYGAGLRGGEVVMLRVGDIDSERADPCRDGKGRKDRHAMLSPQLLELRGKETQQAMASVRHLSCATTPKNIATMPIAIKQAPRTLMLISSRSRVWATRKRSSRASLLIRLRRFQPTGWRRLEAPSMLQAYTGRRPFQESPRDRAFSGGAFQGRPAAEGHELRRAATRKGRALLPIFYSSGLGA